MQKILHTMLRITDMQNSVNFYTKIIGMRVLRTLHQPSEKYTLTFLGFSEEADACALELTYNDGIADYVFGNAYGHIAISVDDCSAACADIGAKGGKVSYGPKRLEGSNEIIAFVSDPDGYQIELIQKID